MPKFAYDKYFPFDTIRHEQRVAIEFILDAFESGKKYVIAELGTGVGKSALGIAVARYLEAHAEKIIDTEGLPLTGTYVLTTQKILQQQYIDDFGPGVGKSKNLLLSIKSASNYQCTYMKTQTCAEAKRVMRTVAKNPDQKQFISHCKGNKCPYVKAKSDFLQSPIAVTNFSYFLAETTYGKQLKPRALLINDEAHNIEAELGKFIEIVFSEKFAIDVLNCKIPPLTTINLVFSWVKKQYKLALNRKINSYKTEIDKLAENNDTESEEFITLSKQYELLDKHVCKVNRFIALFNENNWVMNVSKPSELPGKKAYRKFEFKPVDVSHFSEESLFSYGGRVLMMSATIINKDVFCRSLGVKNDDVAFITIPSPFPIENRPVHYLPIGSMSKTKIDRTLPLMVEAVKMIIDQHPNEKGIIHTANYKVSQYLVEKLKSDRILTHNSTTRELSLRRHITSSKPTVIVSPSMLEGVNLSDDASRFQIICKIPFPYLGDQVVKKRMESDKFWYTFQTIKSIIQGLGRSIRHENDHAVSYILDSDWFRFYLYNKKMFPLEFELAMVKKQKPEESEDS